MVPSKMHMHAHTHTTLLSRFIIMLFVQTCRKAKMKLKTVTTSV